MTRKLNQREREARMKNLEKAREAQLRLNPKQEAFLEAYYNPTSETYANVYKSALRAGYKDSYARLMKSPSVNNKWITIENYKGADGMTEQHIIGSIERIAMRGFQDKDRLQALKLLAQLRGMVVDKQIVGHVNIEQALSELK